EPSNGTLGQPPPRVIKKNSLTVWRPLPPASRRRFLREQLLTQAPIVVERFLCLRSVGHDALLVAFATNSQYAFLLIDINQVQAGEFAHAQPRRVKELQKRTIAPHIDAVGLPARFLIAFGDNLRNPASIDQRTRIAHGSLRGGPHICQAIQKAVHLFRRQDRRNALWQLWSGNESGGIFCQQTFAHTIFEKRTKRGKLSRDRAFFQPLIVQMRDEFTNDRVRDL